MFKTLRTRIRQGYRTTAYPRVEPVLPDRFRGLPVIERSKCPSGCRDCRESCPTGAIESSGQEISIDLGRCIFCTACELACPHGAIRCTGEYRLAARTRKGLILDEKNRTRQMSPLDKPLRRLFGRSLKLREVSAGGCNACEADVNVLNTLGFDLGRFGVQFVASPRHADGMLVTGPVTKNMRLALEKTYAAIPAPKIVIALGACAISGGIYSGHDKTCDGVESVVPVDLYVPGCPPHPFTTLDGILRLLGRIT